MTCNQIGNDNDRVASQSPHLGVQQITGNFPMRLGTGKSIGEQEHALAAVYNKEVVGDVGRTQALARLPDHACKVLHRTARLEHQPAHLLAAGARLSTGAPAYQQEPITGT